MAVSLQQVAERAGVSIGTVSHVLNENAKAGIAVATQERVRRAASDLGYRPNRMARSLKKRKTDTIGILVGNLRNPFHVKLVGALEEAIIPTGYDHLVDATYFYQTARTYAARSHWPVDGLIAWLWPGISLGPETIGADIPVVALYTCDNPTRDVVTYDYATGMSQALEHLQACGYKRIGVVRPEWDAPQPGLLSSYDRFHVYANYCKTTGSQPLHFPCGDRPDARALGLRIAAMPPAARPEILLCHNDDIAIGLFHGLIRGGLRIPEDIGLIGHDGIDEGQDLHVPLTTISVPFVEQSRVAVQLLLELIKDGPRPAARRVALPTAFHLGETTRRVR